MSFGTFQVVGKRGKKQNYPWKEPTASERDGCVSTALIRANDARRCLVDAATSRLYWVVDLHRLFNVGGISGKGLFFWQLCFAVLFAGNIWGLSTQLVLAEARVVAGLANFFSCAA